MSGAVASGLAALLRKLSNVSAGEETSCFLRNGCHVLMCSFAKSNYVIYVFTNPTVCYETGRLVLRDIRKIHKNGISSSLIDLVNTNDLNKRHFPSPGAKFLTKNTSYHLKYLKKKKKLLWT